jgi:phage-related protein
MVRTVSRNPEDAPPCFMDQGGAPRIRKPPIRQHLVAPNLDFADPFPYPALQNGKRNCFPDGARSICLAALTIAAEGGKADIAKPMHGLGSGVFEIALAFQSNAFRVVYAVQLADEIWVVHAYQKKSTKGIRTPKHEIDLISNRLKRLKEMLK